MSDPNLFHCIMQGTDRTALDAQFPAFPLDAPGMPLPGPDFVRAAMQMGDPPLELEGKGEFKRVTRYGRCLEYLYRRALYDEQFTLPVKVKERFVQAPLIPGHLFGDDTRGLNGGPRRARVMLIGKHPGMEEVAERRNFVGPTSSTLYDALADLEVPESVWCDWYITNLVKWPQLDRQSDTLSAAWKDDCALLLAQELRLVRPDVILCLGSEASKFMLGTSCGVSAMSGVVMDYPIPVFQRGDPPMYHNAKVMACPHPASVFHRPEMLDPFNYGMNLFVQLVGGADVGAVETDIDHRVIYKAAQLRRIVDEIRADPTRWIIAADGEWQGQYPTDKGAYLRTVQFSSRHGEGYTIVLRYQGGAPAFVPSIEHAVVEMRRLFLPDPAAGYYPKVGGHFFRSDLPWLYHEGVNLIPHYGPPPDIVNILEGGWDTSLEYHAVNETASFKLEDVGVRVVRVPRYDKLLQKWKAAYCKQLKLDDEALDGYGDCPDWILHPHPAQGQRKPRPSYACYDPDTARRIHMRCIEEGGLLDRDMYGQNSWEPYWVAHRASPAFLEMEMTGICLDSDRVDLLTNQFMLKLAELLTAFQTTIGWVPDERGRGGFNPGSAPQCRAFLFGDRYAYKQMPDGSRVSLLPPGVNPLNLEPIKSTGKRSKLWSVIRAKREEAYYTPSTDKETLGILGHAHPLAMQLRDLKFIAQVMKSVLRPPLLDEVTGTRAEDEDGNYQYAKGLAASVHDDGRIRTHLYQTKETGRLSSARPALQNISNRREDDYKRILGDAYTHPLRTILRASPGNVLVYNDLKGAELAVLAWMSEDPVMIEHVRRNNLPDGHPDQYDIHSQMAVKAFHLSCPPTKKGLKAAGVVGLRVAAKNVIFGIPYGRAADAIARQCREEGVTISVEDTQKIIDFYFEQYPLVEGFLQECRDGVHGRHWETTCFGRRRRCVPSSDRKVAGDQERQFQNFPIQGSVADAISRALDNMYWYRSTHPEVDYKLVLQMHDAILTEVPAQYVKPFVQEVIPRCMVEGVPVWPRRLDGTPLPVSEPYYFGVDTEISINWGETITEEEAIALGIDVSLV